MQSRRCLASKFRLNLSQERPNPFFTRRNHEVQNLLVAIKDVLKNLPKKEFLPKVVIEKVMSLEDMITHLTKRVTDNLRMSFKEFSGADRANKAHVIVELPCDA